jgi:hypothetical protein
MRRRGITFLTVAVVAALIAVGLAMFGTGSRAQEQPGIPFRTGLIDKLIVTPQARLEDLMFSFCAVDTGGLSSCPGGILLDESSLVRAKLLFSANFKNLLDQPVVARVSVGLFGQGNRLLCAASEYLSYLAPREAKRVEISFGGCGGFYHLARMIEFFQVAPFVVRYR